jgi:methionine biosynthesis protein MetW
VPLEYRQLPFLGTQSASDEVDIICHLIRSNRTVLDCGCGAGEIARLLVRNKCEVVGIEADPETAMAARQWCQDVIVGDLEREETLAEVQSLRNAFDCILCSHVLEHLRDPSRLLQSLQGLCTSPTGNFVIALPNVAHWRVRLSLLLGCWEYQDFGILDRTHLRFFTLASALDLLKRSGLETAEIRIPDFHNAGRLSDYARSLMRRVTRPGWHAGSFVFLCTPADQRDRGGRLDA